MATADLLSQLGMASLYAPIFYHMYVLSYNFLYTAYLIYYYFLTAINKEGDPQWGACL